MSKGTRAPTRSPSSLAPVPRGRGAGQAQRPPGPTPAEVPSLPRALRFHLAGGCVRLADSPRAPCLPPHARRSAGPLSSPLSPGLWLRAPCGAPARPPAPGRLPGGPLEPANPCGPGSRGAPCVALCRPPQEHHDDGREEEKPAKVPRPRPTSLGQSAAASSSSGPPPADIPQPQGPSTPPPPPPPPRAVPEPPVPPPLWPLRDPPGGWRIFQAFGAPAGPPSPAVPLPLLCARTVWQDSAPRQEPLRRPARLPGRGRTGDPPAAGHQRDHPGGAPGQLPPRADARGRPA